MPIHEITIVAVWSDWFKYSPMIDQRSNGMVLGARDCFLSGFGLSWLRPPAENVAIYGRRLNNLPRERKASICNTGYFKRINIKIKESYWAVYSWHVLQEGNKNYGKSLSFILNQLTVSYFLTPVVGKKYDYAINATTFLLGHSRGHQVVLVTEQGC